MRRLIVASLAIAVLSACSGGSSPVSVGQAAADPEHWCPGNASNAPYDLHATVLVHNPTSANVAISDITAQMKLEAVKGPWLEKVGDVYNAGDVPFTPATAPARTDTTVKVTIRSACTSPAYGASGSNYGDYRITLRVKTSAGTYSATAENLHRILTA